MADRTTNFPWLQQKKPWDQEAENRKFQMGLAGNQETNPSMYSQLGGDIGTGSDIAASLRTMNLGRGRFDGMGFTPQQANLFYNQGGSGSGGDGGVWGGIKKYAGKQGISDWLDAAGTLYGIYKNETVTEPMLREQQRRAAELWGVQKPILEYNLASAKRNEGRADAYKVGLWNAQRPQGTEERTIEQGMPRTTYV